MSGFVVLVNDPPVLAALRLGLYQLLYLGGVADYAAVDESVELAKRARPAAAGLVRAETDAATNVASIIGFIGILFPDTAGYQTYP